MTLESRQIDSPVEAARLEIKTGRYVKITVAATGSGIREDIKNRIFEPYFTTKGKETVTGLGLATTHGIVKNHGGSIHFESMENKGSTFHVYLPQVETSDNRILLDENRSPASFHGRRLFEDDQAELVETGVCSFVNKPFSIHQLADKIQELLRRKL